MALDIAFEVMMILTSACALMVSAWLFWRARRQRSMKALAGFGIMMALWCAGHVAVFHGQEILGVALILANPLMPTFFLDFAIGFVNQGPASRPWLNWLARRRGLLYLISLLVIVLSLLLTGGNVIEFGYFRHYFVFQGAGWFNIAYTVVIGILAHAILLWGFGIHKGNRRRSIAAMFVAGAWGLWLATSFIFPSLGLYWYPYPMLLLPSYVVLLVYGVVRYQMLEVNAWANRALLWTLMTLLVLGLIALLSSLAGQFGMQALANVPKWQLWLYSMLMLTLAVALYQPVGKLVERLIYPGIRLNEQLLDTWQAQLRQASSWSELVAIAETLISRQMGQAISVHFYQQGEPIAHTPEDTSAPRLTCHQYTQGWHSQLSGWDDVTPGLRLAAEVFASLLATRCGVLERSLQLAETERKRLAEQHLVELGGLSAAMAHELRNPLNIISMASAGLDPDRKAMIQNQLKRADRLISDMLSYSGRIQIQRQPVRLKNLIDSLSYQFDWQQARFECALPAELVLNADPYRLQQVFTNLIDNALAFVRNQQGGIIRIEAGDGAGCIRIHNNGPAVTADMRHSLFRPFVSKRAGGSGLGLAIVRRIMDAHGGRIRYRDNLDWPVSFELFFPQEDSL